MQIEQNFETHAERIEKKITELELRGDSKEAKDINDSFETSLEVHERVLEKIVSEKRDGKEVERFLPKVKEKREKAKVVRQNMKEKMQKEKEHDEESNKEDDR